MTASARPRTLRVHRRIDAPAQRVFDAWLDPGVARRWLFATASRPAARAEIDPRVGGAFRFVDMRGGDAVEYRGRYREIEPGRRLAFTLALGGDAPPTHVRVDIVASGNRCRLALTHEDVPSDRAAHIAQRWIGMLYGLDATLAPGRQTKTPDERSE
jgi:uncharacterized protein YndB with AHSA1/START domain